LSGGSKRKKALCGQQDSGGEASGYTDSSPAGARRSKVTKEKKYASPSKTFSKGDPTVHLRMVKSPPSINHYGLRGEKAWWGFWDCV